MKNLTTTCFLLLASLFPLCAQDAAQTPKWIWADKDAKSETIYARRAWTLSKQPDQATLSITCDNGFTAFINGKKVGSGDAWETHYKFNISKHLKPGDNVIAVQATNEGSVAGLIARLTTDTQTLVTDAEWHVSGAKRDGWKAPSVNTEDWQKPVIVGKLGDRPWGNVFGKNSSAGVTASSKSKATVHPKGFQVEMIYDVPKGEQGSWVSMAIDEEGRLYCSDQGDKGIYRVTMADQGEPKVERLPLEITGAHGLLWAFDSLYVCVNGGGVAGRGSGLYRITDSNSDGELDEITALRKMQGGGEHGPHAVVLSPDGESLFVLGGNHTKPPAPESSSVVPNYAEDQLLPRSPDARGHAASIRAPGGWIAKTDPDGEAWDFFCSGFRNQYDIAFNSDGEMFTYDSDMEWDSGMPWYRPTRIYHCISGAEFGWRTGTGKWPAWYPDALPPSLDIGPGCPTGVMSGRGAKFPAKYQNAIYAFDWTYGTIYAIHLTPQGSTYAATKEEFVTGVPLNVTDGVIGKDGNFYFAVGGRGTNSALYRVSYRGNAPTELANGSNKLGWTERNIRHELEKFHGRVDSKAVDAAWPSLGHNDRFIRYAARTAIEHQPVSEWRERALNEPNPQARLTALLALARQGEKSDQPALLNQLSRLPLADMPEAQQLEAHRVLSLCFIRMGRPAPELAKAFTEAILPYYPAATDALNREFVAMLVYLNAPEVVARTVPLLDQDAVSLEEIEFDDALLNRSRGYGGTFLKQKESNPQRQQIHYVYALKNATEGWTPKLRKDYFTWFAKARNFKGGASFEGFIENFRKESLEKISDPAERAAMDALSKAEVRLVPEGFEQARKETIGMLANMKYNKDTLIAKAGSKLALAVINDDPMKLMHNLALLAPDSLEKVLKASIDIGPEAIEQDFIPTIPEVLASTPQIAPGRQYVLYIDVPKTPGEYPYVCTYPGHGQLMRGVLTVTP
ncbi:heme-binding protein [Verrucomicrobiales bacterium]|jgi:azurin|nr:heme-binding protein [Verrucomicrobiales bacterium]MDB2347842.1 heme-binding protein [Verrucomicrobiales bacterium]MDB4808566.1 heme-binding protein [Verrucomicrobiales bacterium]MDF1786885.1 heme-binding protein [Verrucomicrobiales bacterium]